MKIGYARVSTQEQNLNLQIDALKAHGCEKIFTDKASGSKEDRKGLEDAIKYARKGDTIVCWRLDRISRSLRHLIKTVESFEEQEINFCSLSEKIDSQNPGGRLIFHIFASLAEFERNLIRERTKAGLKSARARGRIGGRPPVLSDEKLKLARELSHKPNISVAEICRSLGVSRSTYYRSITRN